MSLIAIVTTLRAAGCVFAEDEARLLVASAATPAELAAMIERRVAGEPLEHVVGWAEFCGLRIAVDPGVFVPRRRTEFLVHTAATIAAGSDTAATNTATAATGSDTAATTTTTAAAQSTAATDATGGGVNGGVAAERPGAVVVDLCCGSGALGAALASLVGPVELHAADLDPVAVRCARRNVGGLGARVYEGDLFEPLPDGLRGRVDLLLANVPYVPTGEVALLPGEARDHEARMALDGGGDGLDVLRRVSLGAPGWLAPGGHMFVEVSERQVATAEAILAAAGMVPRLARSEEFDATVIVGRRRP